MDLFNPLDPVIVLTKFLVTLGVHDDPEHPIQWNMNLGNFDEEQVLTNHTGYYQQDDPAAGSPQPTTGIPLVFGNHKY